MKLWIRSQDGEKLVCCNDIAIATDSEDGKTIRGYKIVGYFDKNTEYEELGFYTSRTRALGVLDEIENCLSANCNFSGTYQDIDLLLKGKMLNGLYGIIYKMPKK